ncbi:MarR family transcriptional regulator [Comamonas humi]
MTASTKPQGCTNFKLRQLTRVVSRHYDAYIADSGLKTSQYSLLSNVAAHGPIRPVDLAARMRMDASTLTRNLKPLIAEGWVAMGEGADARSRLLTLTEAGQAKREEARTLWRKAQLALNDRLGVERVLALHTLIDEALAVLGDE